MREERGDLWTYEDSTAAVIDARVITTNGELNRRGEAIMGTGTAAVASDYFLGLAGVLGEYIKQHGNRCFRMPKEFSFWDGSRLVTMPTKDTPRRNSDISIIERSAMELVLMADKFDWQLIVMPRAGCGSGRLIWDDVRPILAELLDDRFVVLGPPA
jgi:hypothetical protein